MIQRIFLAVIFVIQLSGFGIKALADDCAISAPSSISELTKFQCEQKKAQNCHEFYKELTSEGRAKMEVDCSKGDSISPFISCAAFGAAATTMGISKLADSKKEKLLKLVPKLVSKYGVVMLPFAEAVAMVVAVYSTIDLSISTYEQDKSCFEDFDGKRSLLELLSVQGEIVTSDISSILPAQDLNRLKLPPEYLNEAFVKNVSCSTIKDISAQQKRKLDAALGPLLASGKIKIDPRKREMLTSEESAVVAFFARNQKCIPAGVQAEILCGAGNAAFGIKLLSRYVSNFDALVRRQSLNEQRLIQHVLQSTKEDALAPLKIKKIYEGEEKGMSAAFGSQRVKYLSDSERAALKVEIKDGKLYDAKGNPYDTSESLVDGKRRNSAMFVMDASGNIYISKVKEMGVMQHSSIIAGGPAMMAGEVEIFNGVVISFNKKSGHYAPSEEYVEAFKKFLQSKGVDISKAKYDPSIK